MNMQRSGTELRDRSKYTCLRFETQVLNSMAHTQSNKKISNKSSLQILHTNTQNSKDYIFNV